MLSQLPPWQVVRSLGRGGFGETTLVEQEGKRYVLKRLRPEILIGSDSQVEELFLQEAAYLRALGDHPQIPNLIDSGVDQDGMWLLQEYIPGENLEKTLATWGVWTEDKVLGLLGSLLPVLQTLHSHQVIHRDIKPANIIWWNEQYHLVDFGASKVISETELRRTGTMIGSAIYAAPEQTLGKAVYASDIYSLGMTCIHLLTGISPFDLIDTGTGALIWKDYLLKPISLGLEKLINKMLERGTNHRYQSAEQVLVDLNTLNQPPEHFKLKSNKKLRKHALMVSTILACIVLPGILLSLFPILLQFFHILILLILPNILFCLFWIFNQHQEEISRDWQIIRAETGKFDSLPRILALQNLNHKKERLGNISFINTNLSGINLDNAQLNGANLNGANLSNANLRDADLSGADLSSANLIGVNFISANLVNANLCGANLSGANLFNVNLCGANLSGTDLSSTNLSGANLKGANLSGSELLNANLNGAKFDSTDLSSASLRGAKYSIKQLRNTLLCQTILSDGSVSTCDCNKR